jgi:hypothetical protein
MKFVLLSIISLVFLCLDIFAVKDYKYESLSFSINSLKEQIEILNEKINHLDKNDTVRIRDSIFNQTRLDDALKVLKFKLDCYEFDSKLSKKS